MELLYLSIVRNRLCTYAGMMAVISVRPQGVAFLPSYRMDVMILG